MLAIPQNLQRRKRPLALVVLVSLLALLLPAVPGMIGGATPSAPTGETPSLNFGQLPFQFEENAGQTNPDVRYLSRAPGGTFYFTSSGVVLSLSGDKAEARSTDQPQPFEPNVAYAAEDQQRSDTVSLAFIGSEDNVTISGQNLLPGKINYFLGSDPTQWHTGMTAYGEVTYSALYPGIDLTYGGHIGQLKGTYTLAPGADPGLIRWQYQGDSNPQVSVSQDGTLQVEVAGSRPFTITEQAPIAWQDIDGSRISVSAAYKVAADGSVSFELGEYNPAQPLVIDPVLTYSTYLGGNFAETGYGLAVDPAGNFYVTGYTNSSNFPTPNAYQPTYGGGGQDGFVAKFDPQGQPVYITYLGGNSIDSPIGIDTDSDGNAYITGFTASANFPILNAYQPTFGGGFYDAFITKLNPSGSALVFSTYLGGTGHENSQGSGSQSGEIAVDAARNIYVAGYTTSSDYPLLNPLQPTNHGGSDLFVTKFNPAATALVWSTFLGGTSTDIASGIAVDGQNNVAVGGYTYSEDYPTHAAFQPGASGPRDAILSKLNSTGSAFIYSTYMGGAWDDLAYDVDLDSAGNAYLAGHTDSITFPLVAPYDPVFQGLSEAFIAKFTPAGVPVYSTYLGGDWLDSAHGIRANEAGEAFVMGSTQSEDFPLMNPIDDLRGGSEDAFVARFNPSGSALVFSTYLGGNDNRELQNGASIAVDSANNIYVSGDTGATDFPTTANAFQPFRGSAVDAFVSRISEQPPTPTATATGSPQPSPTACIVGNYIVTQSSGAALVPGTTYLPNSACDECTAPITFPFPVKFYDQTFTQGVVSSEGNLQFTSDNPLNLNFCLPYGGMENVIYAYWEDLYIGGDGVYTSISGSAPNRIFNIEWRGEDSNTFEPVNFEIRLYEGTGQIDLVYAQLGGTSGESATTGVQRDTGSLYTQFSCDQPLLSPGTKLSFTLPACLTPTATSLTPTPTATATVPPPTLLYSTYYGSFERDSIVDMGRDAAGNIYVAGTTFQNDIDFGDLYISKFSPDGQQLLYLMILGGTRLERAYSLAVDPAGNATIAGIATSFDYPTLNPIQPAHAGGIYDVVMTKLNPNGGVIWSTYLGGNEVDYGFRIRSDAAGDLYLAGETESTDFPTTSNAYQPNHQGSIDGYVAKINSAGTTLLWSTYLGGIYQDGAYAVTTDAVGNVYATGHTTSPDFPTLNAFQPNRADTSGDAFVTKLTPDGSALVYSTYLGGHHQPGPGEDSGNAIAVDASGHAYIAGWTESPNFPTTLNSFEPYYQGYEDAFITKLNPTGNALVYSAFIGGTREERAFDVAVNGAGEAHITGFTASNNFPVVNAIQPLRQDRSDAFVTKLNAAGSAAVYSTFLGGDGQIPFYTGDDVGAAILIDGVGNAVIAGSTSSYDFPVVNPYQFQHAGESDGFISKISGPNSGPSPTATSTTPATVSPTLPATTTSQPTETPGGSTPTSIASVTSTGTIAPPSVTPTLCSITFTDVPEGSTFYVYIQCLACRGIVTGYGDGTFLPGNNVTRGQLSKIVANGAGFLEPVSGQTFTDVPPGHTFYEFIERLAARDIINGYPDGTFLPGNNATRGQISKIVAIAAGFTEPVSGQTFTDVPPGHTFYEFIERLAARDIINGYPDGTFLPGNNATRGQTSKIVSNSFFPECSAP